MADWLFLSVFILGIIVVLLGVFLWNWKKSNKEFKPDYYTLFIMGMIWFPLGIPLKNYFLSVMGLVFFAVGLANKDKWKENRKNWNDLNDKEKKQRMLIMSILGIVVLVGFLFFVLVA